MSASAPSGTTVATIGSNTVTWNGSLAALGSVTVTITATVGSSIAPGTVVSNQGVVSYDADGNGSNESSRFTDDLVVAGTADPTNFTVTSPATLTATKSVSGNFNPGGAVIYIANLSNTGQGPQFDNAGDEFTDVLPSTLTLVGASASSGTVVTNPATRTVTWNGTVTPGTPRTIIGDDATPAANLSLSVTSSNPTLVSPAGLAITGSGASRTLTVTPAPDQIGQTIITVAVGDGAQTTSEPFVLPVNPPPANIAPTLNGVADATIEETKTLTLTLTVGDEATPASALAVTAMATNGTLVPASGIGIGGTGATRTLSLTPLAEKTGQTTVHVTVNDGGGGSTTHSMLLTVIESTSPPLPPTGLTATAVGNEVTLTWIDPVTGATPTFDVVEGGSAPGVTTLPVIFTPTRVTRRTMTVPPGVYFFRVRTANRKGTSTASAEVMVGVSTAISPPGAPTGLAATVSDSLVTLGWQPSILGAAPLHWQLDLGSMPGGSDRGVFTLPREVTTVTGDLADGEYFARVRGGNGGGLGPASNDTRFRVGPVAACDAPETPVLLPATVNGPVVTLSWRASRNAPVSNYRLMVGSVPGASDLAILDVGTVTSFRIQAPPGRYFVTLMATNACGSSVPSNTIDVLVTSAGEPTPAPANLRVAVNGSQVALAWDPVSVATSYIVEAGSTPGLSNAGIFPHTGTGMVIGGVPSGTYYARVRAVGPGGTSVPSVEVVVVVVP